MIFMDSFNAWFIASKNQIETNYFKKISIDNKELKVQINKKAKQLWSNMPDIEKNEWKNKIEIIDEVKPQKLTKLVLKTPKVKKKKNTKKAKKSKKRRKEKKSTLQ